MLLWVARRGARRNRGTRNDTLGCSALERTVFSAMVRLSMNESESKKLSIRVPMLLRTETLAVWQCGVHV